MTFDIVYLYDGLKDM